MMSILVGPVVLTAIVLHQSQLQGVYRLSPFVVAVLTAWGFFYGLKRTWRIYRMEREERVRERVRQNMRRRYS
jgi:hypothetical protein